MTRHLTRHLTRPEVDVPTEEFPVVVPAARTGPDTAAPVGTPPAGPAPAGPAPAGPAWVDAAWFDTRHIDPPTEVLPVVYDLPTVVFAAVTTTTTSPAPVDPDRTPARGLRTLLGPSLELNAVALMATTGITAACGLLFWAVAARHPAEVVGQASAVITTATMLSVLAGLAVGLLFSRFLGSAGAGARSMVVRGYAVVIGSAALLGAIPALFPTAGLFSGWLDRLAFPLLVIVLAVFAVQDWVLIGLREARLVPLEQFGNATLKLGLLVALSAVAMDGAIVASWAVPALLAVLVISPWLFFRVLPRRTSDARATPLPDRRALVGIFVAEYAVGVTTVVIPMMLPLVVIASLGTAANAYYALPWTICEAVGQLIWNLFSSFTVEASNDERETPRLLRRTLVMSSVVGVVATVGLLLGAPIVLSLLGPDYVTNSTFLLQLMALSIPATIVVNGYIAVARLRRKMREVVVIEFLIAVLTLVPALLLVRPWGIDGVGIAFLGSRVLVALIVLPSLIGAVRGAWPTTPLVKGPRT